MVVNTLVVCCTVCSWRYFKKYWLYYFFLCHQHVFPSIYISKGIQIKLCPLISIAGKKIKQCGDKRICLLIIVARSFPFQKYGYGGSTVPGIWNIVAVCVFDQVFLMCYRNMSGVGDTLNSEDGEQCPRVGVGILASLMNRGLSRWPCLMLELAQQVTGKHMPQNTMGSRSRIISKG